MTLVPHTHWDREWYSPFQTFRLRLVALLDDLLPRLDQDPAYAHFLLDGQMAVVDDYLAVRPEAEQRLRRLAVSGRLAMGPWYILMDEFLVSGETMIRDLRKGIERAAAFGGAMAVGYLPDMFGHVAQMPQLLRQFGFEHAVVWRGVPRAIDRTGFWWEAPDGSTVRAEYLPEGYGNGAVLPEDAKDLVARIEQFVADHPDTVGDEDPILWMNGTDHQVPRPWLGRVVSEANAAQDQFVLQVGSLEEHVRSATTDDLPTWRGELRSGARANLLMGVGSNRVDVKQAAARAERALERIAEPLCALFGTADDWPAVLLDEAWTEVIRNSAHDSICACSVDEVCDAVIHRYAEATQIAEGLAAAALASIVDAVDHEGSVVVNPSPRTRGGLVEVVVPGVGEIEGTQIVQQWDEETVLFSLPLREAAQLVQPAVDQFRADRVAITRTDTGARVTLSLTDDLNRQPAAFPRRDLDRLVSDPDGTVEVRVQQDPKRRVLARVDDVPGYGWLAVDAVGPPSDPVLADGEHGLTNGLVTVEVDAAEGTFAVDGLAGLGRLVDDGDVGDTYNYCPPDTDVVVDRPAEVRVDVLDDGPVRGRLQITSTYRWPHRADGSARSGEREVDVTTTVELRAGERFVRVTTAFDNTCRDHRLRAWFPLPEPAASSFAECAFAVVERGLEAEGGPSEIGVPTFPSRRFVRAGGLTIAHEGLLEYELVDIADGRAGQLALTLLRATGMLSQGPMTTRPLPAGPMTPMEGPQVQGPIRVQYAVQTGDTDPYALVDDAFLPLRVARAWGGGDRPARGQALQVSGAEVSAATRQGGRLEVRVFNPTPEEVTVRMEGRHGWLVDLRGAPVAPFVEEFALGPWRIATAALVEEADG